MIQVFDEDQLRHFEDAKRTPIKGWFVRILARELPPTDGFQSACEETSAANTGERENKTEGGEGMLLISTFRDGLMIS
jgi:hypothetical protein